MLLLWVKDEAGWQAFGGERGREMGEHVRVAGTEG